MFFSKDLLLYNKGKVSAVWLLGLDVSNRKKIKSAMLNRTKISDVCEEIAKHVKCDDPQAYSLPLLMTLVQGTMCLHNLQLDNLLKISQVTKPRIFQNGGNANIIENNLQIDDTDFGQLRQMDLPEEHHELLHINIEEDNPAITLREEELPNFPNDENDNFGVPLGQLHTLEDDENFLAELVDQEVEANQANQYQVPEIVVHAVETENETAGNDVDLANNPEGQMNGTKAGTRTDLNPKDPGAPKKQKKTEIEKIDNNGMSPLDLEELEEEEEAEATVRGKRRRRKANSLIIDVEIKMSSEESRVHREKLQDDWMKKLANNQDWRRLIAKKLPTRGAPPKDEDLLKLPGHFVFNKNIRTEMFLGEMIGKAPEDFVEMEIPVVQIEVDNENENENENDLNEQEEIRQQSQSRLHGSELHASASSIAQEDIRSPPTTKYDFDQQQQMDADITSANLDTIVEAPELEITPTRQVEERGDNNENDNFQEGGGKNLVLVDVSIDSYNYENVDVESNMYFQLLDMIAGTENDGFVTLEAYIEQYGNKKTKREVAKIFKQLLVLEGQGKVITSQKDFCGTIEIRLHQQSQTQTDSDSTSCFGQSQRATEVIDKSRKLESLAVQRGKK